MKIVITPVFLIVGCFLTINVLAQEKLKKIEGPGISTIEEVYVNDNGEIFAKIFYVAFKTHITKDVYQAKNIKSQNIKRESILLLKA